MNEVSQQVNQLPHWYVVVVIFYITYFSTWWAIFQKIRVFNFGCNI